MFLLIAVEDGYLCDIGACRSIRNALNILEEIHITYGLLHVLQLLQDFMSVRKKCKEPTKEYLGTLMHLHQKICLYQ